MGDYGSLLKKYINVLVHEGGSDMHFSTGAHPTIRVAGSLSPMLKESVLSAEDTMGFCKALLKSDQMERFTKNLEIDFAYQTDDGYRFRGNAFYQRGSVGIALRLIPKQIQTIKELGLPDILETFARKSQGFSLLQGRWVKGRRPRLPR